MDKTLWLVLSFVLGIVIIGIIMVLGQSILGDTVLELESWVGVFE